MDALSLYKFIEENSIEYHYVGSIDQTDVVMFVDCELIKEFNKLLSSSIYDDEGVECWMKDGYFGFKMSDICDYFGIELEKVFKRRDS